MKPHLAATLCGLLLTTTAFAQSPVTNQHLFDTIPFLPDLYQARTARFAAQPVVLGRTVFLGDSITQMGDWAGLLGDTTVVNRGIGGDITFGVLRRLDDLVVRRPAKLFILLGINDIGKDLPVAVIADNYRKIIRHVQARSPETEIYVQSVLPVNPDHPGFPQHYDKQAQVLRLNTLLQRVAYTTRCRYVNLVPLFVDDQGRLAAAYTVDGLHLKPAGYEVWIRHLKEQGLL